MVERGPFPVGLKVADQYDRTRVFQRRIRGDSVLDGPRPLQTLVWYPAEKSNSRRMTVGDYLTLTTTETSFGTPEETPTSKEWISYLAPVKDGPMQAIRDAPAKEGRDPVILYSPSFSSISWENADLCEYLASFGYIVIAAPAMGENTRESTHNLADAEAQARDVSFLINFAQSLPNTDMTRIAAMGFSWGGLANLLAAAQDHRIRALVSLDGSERYFPGYVQESGFAKPEQMRIPLIYFEEADQSVEAQDAVTTRFHSQGPSVLNAWQHGDLITIHMLGLFHPAFYSLSYRNEEIWKTEFKNLQIADYDYNDCLLQFSWVMRYTRAFLDAYLKSDPSAMDILKSGPRANGVPKHQMEVVVRAASPVASPK
jgi:dienelactone hydrolase